MDENTAEVEPFHLSSEDAQRLERILLGGTHRCRICGVIFLVDFREPFDYTKARQSVCSMACLRAKADMHTRKFWS